MFCPKCKDEFVPRIKECPDCKVSLVEEPPVEQEIKRGSEYVELVTVFEASDASALMFAKSVLDGAGIKYLAKGQGLQNLFGWGVIGTGFNPIVGPVRLQVAQGDEEEALMLLDRLR